MSGRITIAEMEKFIREMKVVISDHTDDRLTQVVYMESAIFYNGKMRMLKDTLTEQQVGWYEHAVDQGIMKAAYEEMYRQQPDPFQFGEIIENLPPRRDVNEGFNEVKRYIAEIIGSIGADESWASYKDKVIRIDAAWEWLCHFFPLPRTVHWGADEKNDFVETMKTRLQELGMRSEIHPDEASLIDQLLQPPRARKGTGKGV